MAERDEVQEWLRSIATATLDQSQRLSEAFYRTLTAVASGAIGFSLVFAEKLAPAPATARFLLVIAWCAFAASLLAVIASFLVTMQRQRSTASRLARVILATLRKTPPELDEVERGGPPLLAWSSLVMLAIGIVLLVAFAAVNYP